MHRGMYDFPKDRYDNVEDAASEAVDRIYCAGIMIWDNKVIPGGNNVMAGSAARAFNDEQLDTLKNHTDKRYGMMAEVIEMRKAFDVAAEGNRAYSDECLEKLQKIYDKVQDLKQSGWTPSHEPTRRSGPRPV